MARSVEREAEHWRLVGGKQDDGQVYEVPETVQKALDAKSDTGRVVVGEPVFLLIEEIESGSQDGQIYAIVSAHTTKAGADAALEAWACEHDANGSGPHAYAACGEDEDEDEEKWEQAPQAYDGGWCQRCGWGASVEAHQLEP